MRLTAGYTGRESGDAWVRVKTFTSEVIGFKRLKPVRMMLSPRLNNGRRAPSIPHMNCVNGDPSHREEWHPSGRSG